MRILWPAWLKNGSGTVPEIVDRYWSHSRRIRPALNSEMAELAGPQGSGTFTLRLRADGWMRARTNPRAAGHGKSGTMLLNVANAGAGQADEDARLPRGAEQLSRRSFLVGSALGIGALGR